MSTPGAVAAALAACGDGAALEQLGLEIAALEAVDSADAVGYFAQEVVRFHSMAATLRTNKLLDNAAALDRQISHILARSLLEGFFWNTYIFWDPAHRQARFEEKLDAFRHEYGKFWNDPFVVDRSELEPAEQDWSGRHKKGVSSILAQLKNEAGARLDFLYVLYRVASFDAHGNSMNVLFQAVFAQECKFQALDLKFVFDLMADHYLGILRDLRDEGEL